MASEQPSLLAKDNLAASNPSFSMFDLCLRAKPLGLANGIITDAMIEASSMHDPNHCPSKCRLNFAGSPSFAFQADKPPHWIKVSLPSPCILVGIGTQSRGDCDQRVVKYTISHSLNGTDWTTVPGVFLANSFNDRNLIVRRDLPVAVRASFVQLNVVEFSGHPSLRWEL